METLGRVGQFPVEDSNSAFLKSTCLKDAAHYFVPWKVVLIVSFCISLAISQNTSICSDLILPDTSHGKR
jgi:hypothetical protein